MNGALRRAVFLDRDGVVIAAIVRGKKPYAATEPGEVRILDGVREACAELSAMEFLLILTTNQPDIARSKISRAFVDETNTMLMETLRLDAVRMCAHDDADQCDCRKPLPGLMTHAAKDLGIALSASFVVGDRWRDVEAGKNAGCRTVFIGYGYSEILKSVPDHVAPSLFEATKWIAKTSG